jgi:hypothetical protein
LRTGGDILKNLNRFGFSRPRASQRKKTMMISAKIKMQHLDIKILKNTRILVRNQNFEKQ